MSEMVVVTDKETTAKSVTLIKHACPESPIRRLASLARKRSLSRPTTRTLAAQSRLQAARGLFSCAALDLVRSTLCQISGTCMVSCSLVELRRGVGSTFGMDDCDSIYLGMPAWWFHDYS